MSILAFSNDYLVNGKLSIAAGPFAESKEQN